MTKRRRDWGSGSIEELGPRRWRVSVSLGRDPVTGKRRRLRFIVHGTKRDAQRALNKAIREQEHGGVDPNRITTGEWLTTWLDGKIRDEEIGPEVSYNYRGILQYHLIPALGDVPLQDLSADQIRALKDSVSEGRAPATVRRIVMLIRQALDAAVTRGLLATSPASTIPLPRVGRNGRERRALDRDEIKELLRVADGTAYAMPIRFALHTGARRGELLGARWDAIDLEKREFHVLRTLHYVDGEFTFRPPKTPRSQRTITLSENMVKRLRDHRAEQRAAKRREGASWEEHDLVFPGSRGRPWYSVTFYKGFRRLVASSSIQDPTDVVFHSLRHTAASQWIAAKVDLYIVSRRLGHADPGFTMRVYAHLLPGQQDAAALASDDFLE